MKILPAVSAAFCFTGAVAGATTVADRNHWKPMYAVERASAVTARQLEVDQAKGLALPSWTSSVVSPIDKHRYRFTILGSDPRKSHVATNIQYVPVVLIVKFTGGVTLDPTQPGCGDTVSVSDRFYKSPLFVPVPLRSNGIEVGPAQVIDGFQRAEFWQLAQGTQYHVPLVSARKPVVLTVNAPSGSQTMAGVCSGSNHAIGQIDINAYDAIVQAIDKKYAKPNQLPFVLTYNILLTSGGCCILGYHSTYPATGGGTQVYAVAAYNDAGVLAAPAEDINGWSHEIGDLYNDPYVKNATPAWSPNGQVSGCQNNLEVGDPVTGDFPLAYGGFTYHPEELTFFSWFYRQRPSLGTGGDYSFKGTWEAPPVACA